MNREIWQTTNQQPWVYALSSGLITVKTRTSKPVVPEGAIVLLHASKSRLWPHWKNLDWTKGCDSKNWVRGAIEAVGIVEAVGETRTILRSEEYYYWDVFNDESPTWNCAAAYSVRFSKVMQLKNPVPVRGFQAPYVRAPKATINKVIKMNKDNPDVTCLLKPAGTDLSLDEMYALESHYSCLIGHR